MNSLLGPDPDAGPWSPAATFGWLLLLIFIAWSVGGTVGLFLASIFLGVSPDTAATLPWGAALASLGTLPVLLLVAWLVRGRCRPPTQPYLGWRSVSPRLMALHLGVFILATAAINLVLHALDMSPDATWVLDLARERRGRVPLWLAVVVGAPLVEEVLFRGFLYRGWQEVHPLFAVVAGAFIFAGLHLQYDWVGIIYILVLGILFGLSRWHADSLWPPIFLHALNNLGSMVLFTVIAAQSRG